MQDTPKSYSQKDIIAIISRESGCSIRDTTKIFHSLCSVIKGKFSDKDDFVEMKLFPGLKLSARYVPSEQSKSNLAGYIKSNDMLFLSAEFSKRFKDSIRESHRKTGNPIDL